MFLMIIITFLCCVTGTSAWGGDLESLIQTYLASPPEHAEAQLTAILSTGASVEAIEKVLANGRTYEQKPTGPWHGIPLQVGDALYRYALYVPEGYNPEHAYPLVVCLHGAGFNGSTYLQRWSKRLGKDHLLACPTIDENGEWWTRKPEALVKAVLADVTRQYHIDANRVFLSGMSNGAVGAFAIGTHQADRFAALTPMAGCYPLGLYPLLQNFRMTPLYLLHGSEDTIMPVQCSRDVFTELARLGIPASYREHDEVHERPGVGGHFFPEEELPDLVNWIVRQKRNPVPKEITLLRDRDHLDRFYWSRIDAVSEKTVSLWDSTVKEGDQLILARLEALVISPIEIEVLTRHVERYTLFLSPSLFDLDKPITITTNGNKSFQGKVTKDPKVLLSEARRNPGALFPATVTITVPSHES